jgi:hypothetical protein
MDLFGIKLLVVIVCISLIVFSGAVAPAFKQHLDTWYGRFIAIVLVMIMTDFAGWPAGVLAAMAVLVLIPATVAEGFVIDEKKPVEGRDLWFSERIMGETPNRLDNDNVLSLPTN